MLAGGTGSRLNITPLTYRGDANLSHRIDEPARASRPFDAARDGLVNGEGAGILLLESREHAETRGANVLARIVARRSSFELRDQAGQRSGRAIRQVIEGCCRDAGLLTADIGHVNAHGLSTRDDDSSEARAIHDTLGDVPVFAPKSYFGNLGTGGGAVELAASVLGLVYGEVPATLNFEMPDAKCPVDVTRGEMLKGRPATAISLNQSGTGQTAGVMVTRS
jgi:3-oxoacyl-[acyl-carrier-protein] synthase II